ncbi:hypothetical protein [Kingella sp. (in: b-proteobacteria)]|nr:hypothetical protein [Kingella sp. (in: b-proteobacteria)]MDO4656964.1 hypothetical protein [Kingella sp. (in: b-proteobacteria)]
MSVFSWKYCKQRYWFLQVRQPETQSVSQKPSALHQNHFSGCLLDDNKAA